MKKSNIVISSIALAILGVVIVCLAAFRVTPEWKADREEQRNPIAEQKAIAGMMAFATKCKDVEELVVQSSKNIKGQIYILDSTKFRWQSNGEVTIDTLFSNGGKKLSFTIEPNKDAQVVYCFLHLMLPALKNISANNANLSIDCNYLQTLGIMLQGESGCNLRAAKPIPSLRVELGGLSAFGYTPSSISDNMLIKASGNAIVDMPDTTIAGQLRQQGKLILQENAIVQ